MGTELQAKYQKLAQEYAKVRATSIVTLREAQERPAGVSLVD